MPAGNPYLDHHGTTDLNVLTALWPEWESFGPLPPLDDWTVECAVRAGLAPAWILDRSVVINKLGGTAHAPSSVLSADWLPVVVKPRWNPNGLATGVEFVERQQKPQDWKRILKRSEIAQPVYAGYHTSTDFAVYEGTVLWGIAATGFPAPGRRGQFTGWEVHRGRAVFGGGAPFETRVAENLPDYSGVLNVETIDGNIIEAHFRPSIEFFPLYGDDATTELMRAAIGYPTDFPKVRGGLLQVIPRSARVVDCRSDLGEWSWRRSLAYLPHL